MVVREMSLRRLDPGVVSRLLVDRMTVRRPNARHVAELAGWLFIPAITETLGHLADHDSVTEVRHAALASLDLHRREAKYP